MALLLELIYNPAGGELSRVIYDRLSLRSISFSFVLFSVVQNWFTLIFCKMKGEDIYMDVNVS